MPVRPALGLRAAWRPGLGLALWPDRTEVDPGDTRTLSELVELPASVGDLVSRRRLRHTVALRGADGTRTLRRSAVVGVQTAVELLDRCEHLSVGGDLAFYRYLLAGARNLRDSGAVAPGVQHTDGEAALCWFPLPTAAWRSWQAVITATAPPALVAGDDDSTGPAALFDFVAEVLDAECRRTLAVEHGRSRIPLIDGLTADAPAPLNPSRSAGLPRSPSPSRSLTPSRSPSPSRSLSSVEGSTATAAAAWQAWLDTGTPDGSSLVLRLHEPDDDDGPTADPDRWRLQVCRRLPTGEIEPVVAHRLGAHDLDEVTSDLAAAVQAFSELSRAEADPHTLDFLLTTDQVADFFATGSSAISAVGITVLLPRTVADVAPSIALRGSAVPGGGVRPGLVGLDEISDFEWRLALGDGSAPLSQDDLDELARQHGDLVRVRGRWVRAEGSALSRAASFLIAAQAAKESGDPGATLELAELMRLITDDDERLPVPVSSVEGLGWLDDVAAGGVLRPVPVEPPASLRAELRPYQQRGLEWLHALTQVGAGGVLADDMGLGKTVQVIALLTCRLPDAAAPALVVCPMSVVGNWQRELERFAPDLNVVVHHGPGRDAAQLSCTTTDVVVTTFATLTRDRDLFTASPWDVLIVDEAQHVKNVRTAASKSLRALQVRRRFALTGTPVENRLEDLRAVIDLVNPGLLGSASSFRARFAEPIERERDPRALDRLNSLTRPFILRRLKTDPAVAADLPEKTELTVRANLTTEQAGLYQATLNDLHEALADVRQHGQRRKSVLAALTRLKQICNHPAHYLGDGSGMLRRGNHRSGKVELLSDIVTTLVDEGDRALIFTQFAAFGALLSEWLSPVLGRDVPMLHGGLPRAERDQLVTGFAGDDGSPILVATLKAGGTGLNLVAANHVIHADRWWNPAVEEQATDRAYRIGQTRSVQVRKFVCVGTLEERIDELIAAKRELSSLTVATGESWLSDLRDDALFDLLALRDEAVGD